MFNFITILSALWCIGCVINSFIMSKMIIYRYGLEVFNKEKVKFKRWLLKTNISLGNEKPIDLINSGNKDSVKMVYNCLIRIEYGIFS